MATWTSGSGRPRSWNMDNDIVGLESNAFRRGSISAISSTNITISGYPNIAITGSFSIRGASFADLTGDTVDNLDYSGLRGNVTTLTAYYLNTPEVTITNINIDIRLLSFYLSSDFISGIFSGNDTINGNDFYNEENTYPSGKWVSDGAGHLFNGNRMHGYNGNDLINGGGHIDSLWGDAGDDTVLGLSGDDFLYGGAGNDRLEGGADNDKLYGNTGNDNLNGGTGDDTLIAGAGNDSLDGGAGSDTADYSEFTKALSVTLNGAVDSTLRFGVIKTDTLKNIENIIGGSGADRITGDLLANVLDGGAGNDTLDGGAGNDALIGGIGKDSLTGGLGSDVFYFKTYAELGLGANSDVIRDFSKAQGDKIDLSSLDAKLGTTVDDSFIFLASAPTTAANANGALWYSNGILYGSNNTDALPEFQINVDLTGITTANAATYIVL